MLILIGDRGQQGSGAPCHRHDTHLSRIKRISCFVSWLCTYVRLRPRGWIPASPREGIG